MTVVISGRIPSRSRVLKKSDRVLKVRAPRILSTRLQTRHQLSTMSSPQPPKGHDAVATTLDVFIQAVNLAKDTCGIPPAQIAFGAASVLLTMIRVRFPIVIRREDDHLTYPFLGHDGQRSGLCRARAVLRWCVSNTLPEIEGERIG
jgi:hypothetical protein